MKPIIAFMTCVSKLACGLVLAIEELMQRSPIAYRRRQIDIALPQSRTTASRMIGLMRRSRKDRELAGAKGNKKYCRRCERAPELDDAKED
jgi:hypothetical protein